MANKKITELDAITTLASTDVVPVVDVSADTTNKITTTNLFRTLPDGTAAAPALAFSSDQANGVYLAGTDTVGISTGGTQRVTVDGSGNVTISGDLQVNGATTTVQSTTVTIDDKNLELGSVATPTDTTANGGGITLKGATDKTINWVQSTGYWTFNTGIEVGGHIQLDDSNKAIFGTGCDLEILHNGANSFITNFTGDLYILNHNDDKDILLQTDNGSGGTTTYVLCDGSTGSTKLNHLGSEKLQTKSDGILVQGEVQSDSLDVNGGVDIDGGKVTYSSNSLSLGDGVVLRCGAGNDLNIYHSGTDSFIDEAGTGNLFVRANQTTHIGKYTGENCGKFIADGAVELYYDNAKKLETKSDGANIVGELECDSLDVDGNIDIHATRISYSTSNEALKFLDGIKTVYGNGDDLQIYHDGNHSQIKDSGTGNLQLLTSAFKALSSDGSETYISAVRDGAVELYHNNSKKLETKSDGIDVTGEVECDSLLVGTSSNFGDGSTGDVLQVATTAGGHLLLGRNDSSVAANNTIGLIRGYSFGGSVWQETARISIQADGAHASGDKPGRIVLATTADGASSPTERLRIDSSGRVLVGATSASSTATSLLLQGSPDGASGPSYLRIATGTATPGSTSTIGQISFTDSGHSTAASIIAFRDGGSWSSSSKPTKLTFSTTANGASSATERLRIKSDGTLHAIKSGTQITNAEQTVAVFQRSSASGSTSKISIVSGNAASSHINFGDTDDEDTGMIAYVHSTNAMQFHTDGNVERMRLDSSGRLLLGTTTEGYSSGDDLTIATSGHTGITVRSGTTSEGAIYFSDATSGGGEYIGSVVYSHNTNSMSFTTNGTNRLQINSNGAWGIEGASNYGTSGQVLTSNGNDSPTWQDIASVTVGGANAISMNDNVKINVGAGNDLQIYHDGNNSFIKDTGTGRLTIATSQLQLTNAADSEVMIRADQDGEVNLYHNGVGKLATKATGIDVTGEVQCDSLDVDGSGDFTGDVTFRGGAAAVEIAANSDIRFINGTWTGDYGAKIQHHGNKLYIQGGSDGFIFRDPDGTDRTIIDSSGHFRPSTNNTYDLGTSSYRWRNVYTNDLNLSNEGSSNDVDGTWGNYTIQEGEDDLFLINRRNGKKYKFNLTEVS